MNNSSNHIILNGELIPENDAAIPAVTSGLYYGAGAFETFLSEGGRIFKYSNHIQRLAEGLEYLGVSSKQGFDEKLLLDQIGNLLKKNDLSQKKARVRIQISLAEKSGYRSDSYSKIITVIEASAIQKKKNYVTLILAENSVISSSARPVHLKLSNMLHYRNASREAEKKGADDSVMLNNDGFVAESSIANIFWMKDDKIFTPSEECDILPGIMRNSIIEILNKKLNYEVKEGKFGMDEMMEADLVWLTNSAIDFIPVSKIQDTSFETDNRFFEDLQDEITVYKEKHMTDV